MAPREAVAAPGQLPADQEGVDGAQLPQLAQGGLGRLQGRGSGRQHPHQGGTRGGELLLDDVDAIVVFVVVDAAVTVAGLRLYVLLDAEGSRVHSPIGL